MARPVPGRAGPRGGAGAKTKAGAGGGLRISGGDWRGRRLATLAGRDLRPTSDRAREALFNILAHGLAYRTEQGPMPRGIAVLDAFAGTGALGLEALSRGAARAGFIDDSPESIRLLRANVAALGAEDRTLIMRRSVLRPGPAPARFRLVLLDPPYSQGLAEPGLAALAEAGWLEPAAVAAVEIAAAEPFTPPAGFTPLDERRYGAARLVLLRYEEE